MRIDQFWSLLRQRLALAVIIFVVVAGGVAAWSLTRTPVYSAEADVYITIAPTDANSSLSQDSQYVLDKVKSYTGIAVEPMVLNPVIAELGLDPKTADLPDNVTATNTDGTTIIAIVAQSNSATLAAKIANSIAAQLPITIKNIEPAKSANIVKASTVAEASVPEGPIFPRNTLNIALGIIAGLLAGVGAAIALGRIDQSVRTGEDLEALTGAAPVGRIGFDRQARNRPIVALNQGSPLTEDYRSVRARLAFASVDTPLRRIMVTSAIPGDGKSTVAVNLAVVLAQSGATVCLIEADVRRPKVSQYLGVENAVGLTDVLVGRYALDAALLPWGDGLLTVLPAGTNPPDPGELFASRRMHDLIDTIADRFDYVICDTPPLLAVADAAVIGRVFDGALLVARHGHASRTKITQAIDSLRASDTRLIGTILNGVPRHSVERPYTYTASAALA